MAINQNDIDLAMYLLDDAIYTDKALKSQDCVLIKKFIEALLEHKQSPSDNVKSREWRAAVYRKLLEDPQALQQFTQQAIEKFGPENLARMVVPDLQEIIVNQHIQNMDTESLLDLLKTHHRMTDILEHIMDTEEDWVRDHFGLDEEQLGEAKAAGYAAGVEDGKEIGRQEADEDEYARGYEDGQSDTEPDPGP